MELSTALEGRYFLWAICHCGYSHLLAVRCVQYCSVFNHNISKLLPVNHLLWEGKVLLYIQSTFTGVLEKVAFLGLMRIFKVITGCDMLLIKLQCIDHCWCKENPNRHGCFLPLQPASDWNVINGLKFLHMFVICRESTEVQNLCWVEKMEMFDLLIDARLKRFIRH